MNINNVVFGGRLTRDPELRNVNTKTGDKAVATFTIANNDPFRPDKTNFLNCQVWGKTAESVAKYLVKGSVVVVEGSLDLDTYEKDGVKRPTITLNARNVQFGSKGAPQGENTGSDNSAPSSEVETGFQEVIDEDDIPF